MILLSSRPLALRVPCYTVFKSNLLLYEAHLWSQTFDIQPYILIHVSIRGILLILKECDWGMKSACLIWSSNPDENYWSKIYLPTYTYLIKVNPLDNMSEMPAQWSAVRVHIFIRFMHEHDNRYWCPVRPVWHLIGVVLCSSKHNASQCVGSAIYWGC